MKVFFSSKYGIKNPYQTIGVGILTLTLVLSTTYVYGWTEPSADPVNGNVGFFDPTLYNFALIQNGSLTLPSATGNNNTAVGYQALIADTSGYGNTANGYYALKTNTTGYNNTALGQSALESNATGTSNTAIGGFALRLNKASYNTATGYWAMYNNVSGTSNTAHGLSALYSNTTGSYNIATGQNSLYNNQTGSNNTANGFGALGNGSAVSSNNVAVGYQALYMGVTNNNTATGYQALYGGFSPSGAGYNVANGYQALYGNTSGYMNTANGGMALRSNTTGSFNTANGEEALYWNTTGTSSVANGAYALYKNTTGAVNSANGHQALNQNTTGSYNTANGGLALYNNTTGSSNTAVGYLAGRYQADGTTALQTANDSIYIGYNSMGYNNSDTNSIVIGSSARGIGANTIVLGNDSIITTALKGNVGIGTTSPTSKLTVAGVIESTFGGFKFPDGTTQTTAGGGGGVPSGAIMPYAALSAPSGWLLCDGTAVSRITYAGLFAVIGTTYGAGDGSTTFNLPNMNGRVPVGYDSTQTEFDILNETGGAKTHALTSAEMPSHTHIQDAHIHVIATAGGDTTGAGNIPNNSYAATPNVNTQSTVATNQYTGGGASHNNLQPYITLRYIIKY